MHIHGIQKDGTDKFICKSAVEKQTQKTNVRTWLGGEEEEGEMYGESSMETYITIRKTDSQFCCMTQVTQIGTQYQPRGLERGENGRFKKEGTQVYLWLIHVDIWQKTAKFCKAVSFN